MRLLTAPDWARKALNSLIPDSSGSIPFDELRTMLQIGPTFTREYLKELGIEIAEGGKIKARWRWEK